MHTTKNYPYAYNNLKNTYENIKKFLIDKLSPEWSDQLSTLKEQILNTSIIGPFDKSQLQNIYDKLKLLSNICNTEGKNLSRITQTIDGHKALDSFLIQPLILETMIKRYQVDLDIFLRDIRLDFLTEIKEEIDITDSSGRTLLMYAVIRNQNENAKRLLEAKADPFLEDPYGNSAFSLALRHKNEEIVKEVIKYKINEDEWCNLKDKLETDPKGLFHFIAVNLENTDSELYRQLDLDIKEAKKCSLEAENACNELGSFTEHLLCDF